MTDPEFLADFIAFMFRFLAGSSLAFLIAYLVDRFGAIKDVAVLESVWRSAVIVSLLFLIPASSLPGTSIEIETKLLGYQPPAPSTTPPTLTDEVAPGKSAARAPAQGISNPPVGANPLSAEEAAKTAPAPESVYALRIGSVVLTTLTGFVLILLAGLAVAYGEAITRLGRRERLPSEGDMARTMREICDKADIRHHPHLSTSRKIESPLCLPGYEVCLPDWLHTDLDKQQFRHVIAHELAHLIRRDPIMLMILQGLSRLFFFQPGFTLARNRLVDLAELQADAWAARVTGDAHGVAEALFTCAKRIDERRQTKNKTVQWGLAMTGNPKILKARVQNLVTAAPSRGRLSPATFLSLTAVAGLLVLATPGIEFASAKPAISDLAAEQSVVAIDRVAPLAKVEPGVPAEGPMVAPMPRVSAQPTPAPQPKEPSQTLRPFDDPKASGNASYRDDDVEYELSFRGIFEIAADLSGVKSMAPGARLTLIHKEDGVTRKIQYRGKNGKIERTFSRDGKERDITRNVEEWEQETLTFMVARKGMAAEQYVPNVYAKGGSKAVFQLAEKAKGDHARRRFISTLASLKDLTPKEAERYVKLTREMDSDYEKRLSFTKLFDQPALAGDVGEIIIEAATDIDSDYETRLLITAALDKLDLGRKAEALLPKVAKTIDSDYEFRLAVSAMLSRGVSPETAIKLLDAASDELDSDYELRLLLQKFLNGEASDSPRLTLAAVKALDKIDGDYERRIGLQAVLENGAMSETVMEKLLETVEDMGSDYERRLVLKPIRRTLQVAGWVDLYDTFNDIREDLGSYERSQVKALRE